MPHTSHNVKLSASEKVHSLCKALSRPGPHNVDMDKNGGPNNLEAWRRFRGMSQEQLAANVEPPTTGTMISMLENGERGLSAKWLRRLGDALKVSPGHLLDHNPYNLDSDILDIWVNATAEQRRQIASVVEALVKTGTH